MRRVEGTVLTLTCSGCGSTFPTFQFSGDTDMVTAGLCSATAAHDNAVAIGEMSSDEWNDQASGLARFAERIGKGEGSEFEAIPLLHAEAAPSASGAVSFAQFRHNYQAPRLIFGCPRCSQEATVTKSSTVADYVSSGGRLIVVGELAVA
jgi:hypothetical protein